MPIMRYVKCIFFSLMTSLFIASCQNGITDPNSGGSATNSYPVAYPAVTSEDSGYPAPESLPTVGTEIEVEVISPQPEKTTVTGFVFSDRTELPIMNVPVSLAEVFREGESAAYVLDGAQSPLAHTDKNGRFAFNNILPGEYVVVIGSVEINDYIILTEPSGQAKVWAATAGNILDLETQFVNLDAWK